MSHRRYIEAAACALAISMTVLALPTTARAQTQPAAVRRIIERDPPVERVRQAALRAYGYAADDLDEWSSRARWSHLLPDVDGEVDWLDQNDSESRYREELATQDTGQMSRDSAMNYVVADSRLRSIYSVELQWDLSGLIYDKSEPRIASEVRRRREARQKLLVAVGEAYYQRRRYLIELVLTPSAKWRKRLDLRLQVDRQTARLDAMTNGWFSRALRKARKEH